MNRENSLHESQIRELMLKTDGFEHTLHHVVAEMVDKERSQRRGEILEKAAASIFSLYLIATFAVTAYVTVSRLTQT